MQFWSAGDGGGDGAIPPTSETSNKVLLGPEQSAEEASRTHPNAQRSVAAGTFLAIADDDIPLEDAAEISCIVGIAGFAGSLLSLRPSWLGPLPRPFRFAPPRSFGGDSAVLAAKRGERPPTGARLGGGGGGGTSSTAASSADESPEAAAASAIPEPILPALLATGSAIYTMINKAPAPAPALTMKLFFVGVLLASVAVVKAERIRHRPHKKVANEHAMEHAIDVARPNDHKMEETQTKEEETVGKLIRSKPRS